MPAQRFLDHLDERLTGVWDRRLAPDDRITFISRVATMRQSDGTTEDYVGVYARLHCPEISEGAVSRCQSAVPLELLLESDEACDELGEALLDQMVGARLAHALEAMEPDAG